MANLELENNLPDLFHRPRYVFSKAGEPLTKIEYIDIYLSNPFFLYLWPVLSTAVLILAVPYLSYWVYWKHLDFKKLKNNKRTEIEGKQLLTLEQSVKLRQEIYNQEKKFNEIIDKKEEELKNLENVNIQLLRTINLKLIMNLKKT